MTVFFDVDANSWAPFSFAPCVPSPSPPTQGYFFHDCGWSQKRKISQLLRTVKGPYRQPLLSLSLPRPPGEFTQSWDCGHLSETAINSWFIFQVFFPPLHHEVCGLLVPWPRIEPRPSALKAQGLNHRTTSEVPIFQTLGLYFLTDYWASPSVSSQSLKLRTVPN